VQSARGVASGGISAATLGCMAGLLILVSALPPALAQDLVPIGPGEPSGSRSSVLPPPSGSQNPVLPPPSGYRYAPGTEGRWGDAPPRPPTPPQSSAGASSWPGRGDLRAVARPSTGEAAASTIDSVSEIGRGFGRCWQPPAGAEGKGFTLRFSLRRNGSVIARARLVAGPGGVGAEAGRRLVESGLAALAKCAPLPLSPALGASIAGRPISLRFDLRG
jgi:hypothetical protein